MSGMYAFSDGTESLDSSAVLVEENSIAWDEDSAAAAAAAEEDQVVIGYTSGLTDTISEGFVTADEDANATQYFSVLETSSETILGDMNISLGGGKEVEYGDGDGLEAGEMATIAGNDIMLYEMPGDGLYGIQLAEDEEGNLQKYQFKLRQNADGQLEAITDSIQILSVDSNEQAELPSEVPQSTTTETTSPPKSPEPTTLLVKQEYGVHSDENNIADENEMDSRDGLQINDEDTALSFEEHVVVETKPQIVDVQKQEVVEETESVFLNESGEVRGEHFENLFIRESRIHHRLEEQEEEEGEEEEISNQTNDSDTEDYNVVDGLHVTGDTEIESVLEAPLLKLKQVKMQNTRLLKNAVRNNYIKGVYESNGFVVNEKENVSNVLMYNYQKPNPRSILKSSFPLLEENSKEVDKRILKNSKVSSQARLLQNFIAKTTIIHAPVRHERLPRKQTIKPVQRQDEEIIVQEVVVSSNGFIETSEGGVLKTKEPLQATVFLNVSDSDDDYDPKKQGRKRRRSKKTKQPIITIVDSEEERDDLASQTIELSDSAEDEKKPEIKCTKCSKTFPSQGSLKTHMQYHNFKETTTTTTSKFTCKHCKAPFKNSLLLNKHLADHKNLGCTICKRIFTTAMELSTHRRLHIKKQMCKSTVAEKHSPKSAKKAKSPPKLLRCDLCSRSFKEAALLEAHAKTHNKFACVNCGVSFLSKMVLDLHVRESCVKMKSPTRKKGIFENVRCEQCGVAFSNHTLLFKHKVGQHGLDTPDKSVLKRNVKKPLCKARQVHGGIPVNNLLRSTYSSIRRKVAES